MKSWKKDVQIDGGAQDRASRALQTTEGEQRRKNSPGTWEAAARKVRHPGRVCPGCEKKEVLQNAWQGPVCEGPAGRSPKSDK